MILSFELNTLKIVIGHVSETSPHAILLGLGLVTKPWISELCL